MKKIKKYVSYVLSVVLVVLSLAACGNSGQDTPNTENNSEEKIVNVGVTNTLETLNPLLMNGGEINRHATALMFLPLVELDKDLNFEAALADSITTEDNLNFIVHIDDMATLLAASDIVICRCGAITLSEIASANIRSK